MMPYFEIRNDASPKPDLFPPQHVRAHKLEVQIRSKKQSIAKSFLGKMKMLSAIILLLSAQLIASQLPTLNSRAPTPAPAPSAPITTSANVTGSLGYYCSTRAGLQQLVQSTASNAAPAGLNVSIPSTLQDATSQQTIAEVCRSH